MSHDTLQQRSDRYAARVEALAAALRDSGVPDEACADLMSLASAAVLQALSLEVLLDRRVPEPEPERLAA